MKFKIVVFLISTLSYSQIAENLFKEKYSKIALEMSTSKLFVDNTQKSILYEWNSSKPFSIGLTYNYLQKGNLNLKLSVLYSFFDIRDSKIFKGNELAGTGFLEASTGPYNLFSLPIESEYFIKLTDKNLLSINSGFELTYNQFGKDFGYSKSNSFIGDDIYSFSTFSYSRPFPIYLGLNLGASYNIVTKPALFKINVKYHYQFEDYIYQGLTETKINGITEEFSKQTITGNYFCIGLTIAPNKNLFK